MSTATRPAPTPPSASSSSRPTLPVAVVVTAHGAARHLREALASVSAQTARPARVVVIDDSIAAADLPGVTAAAQVEVMRHPLGANPGRNLAVLEARQPWIAFLDSDDAWSPHKMETQWRAVEACPGLDVLFANSWEVSEARGTRRPFLEQKPHYWDVERHEIAPGVKECEPGSLVRQFLRGNFLSRSTLLARRDILARTTLFDRELIHLEDRECWLRLLAIARFGVIEEPLMESRLDEEELPDRRHWAYEAALDLVRLRQMIERHPDEYPAEAVAHYTAERGRASLVVGRLAEAAGRPAEARRHYLSSWWLGGGTWPLLRAAASYLPESVREWLADLWAGCRDRWRRS